MTLWGCGALWGSPNRNHEADEIYEHLGASVAAQTVMLWLIPSLFVMALLITLYALRLQDSNRKETIKTLRRTSAEKDRFLATVSHELRTPLTSVLGFIRVLEGDGDTLQPAEYREMLHLASQEAAELSNLVEDLLALARADSGVLSTSDVPVDLAAQAAQVLEAMEGAPPVHLEDHGPIAAQGDPARIRQIIRNLLTNAFHYGGDDVRMHIESGEYETRLQVIDNGQGVPEHLWRRSSSLTIASRGAITL